MKADFEISQQWFMKDTFDKVEKLAMKGLVRGGQIVAGEAMQEAPVLSGTLKRSICVTEGDTPILETVYEKAQRGVSEKEVLKQGEELAVYVSANTPYAHKQHEQNRNHSKFLERALQNNQDTIPKEVEKELKKL